MKYHIVALLLLISVCNVTQSTAQVINQNQLSTINIDDLSDAQIKSYWEKAQAQGYSISQLEVMAKARGMSAAQVSKLKQRITALRYATPDSNSIATQEEASVTTSDLEKFGFDGSEAMEFEKNPLFGFDFFNNPNISFTPNLNMATPETYQLGPGDELLIDIWGAAQNNYRKTVNRDGAILIENIGPIYVSGLPINKATAKIKSYLKKIYSGIGATGASYNKVFAEISLVGVRTVHVNIIGEVKVPGTYALNALSTVLNALYAAGGPTENGTFRAVKVVRNGKDLEQFDFYKYLIQGSEKGNITLRDQDIIIVNSYVSKIEVEGNVKRPGVYELKENETISDLQKYFSGFTSDAFTQRLIVERVNGAQKEVSEIVLPNQSDFLLRDGDKITVGAVIDRYTNRVSIGGAVYRPGNYELTKGLTLNALLQRANGLKDNAFLDRGVIYRTVDDVKQEMLPFNVLDAKNNKLNILLKREDSVHIFDKYELKEKYTVSIDGAVNKPQTIEFAEKMQIEDLIAISGGFKDGADVEVIDISRRVADGSYTTIGKNIKRSSTNTLTVEGTAPFYLEPFDRVSVRYKKGFTVQKNVVVKGEVNYPGSYTLTTKNERVSDLVAKAGGFSPYAYIKGATLTRKINTKEKEAQLKQLEEIIVKDSLSVEVEEDKLFKIGINLEKIMELKGQNSKYDLILEEGDELIIPSEKQTVEVRGEVLSPSLIRYDKKHPFKHYINYSGGFSNKAQKRKAYVIYANGDIKSTKNFVFFKVYPKIAPGALILVPEKPERDRMSVQEMIGITTGLSTLGILINTLVK